MTLEVATYITDLQPLNPTSTDQVNQGDDHLRLIKQVLQNTFPNASKVNYFPGAGAGAAGVIAATNQNSLLYFDTTAGGIAVTLPTLAAGLAGWTVGIIKTSTDANAITVSPPSGNILSQWGAVATIRVGCVCSSARFIWTGANWICSKDGPLIGTTVNFDGPNLPAGYLTLDGSSFSGTTFAELAAALGGTTLRDKRGRAEFGVDSGAVHMAVAGWGGVACTLGSTNYALGGQAQLALANVPPLGAPSGSVGLSISFPNGGNTVWFLGTGTGGASTSGPMGYGGTNNGGVPTNPNPQLSYSASFSGNAMGGSSQAFSIVPPGISSQKIIRAC